MFPILVLHLTLTAKKLKKSPKHLMGGVVQLPHLSTALHGMANLFKQLPWHAAWTLAYHAAGPGFKPWPPRVHCMGFFLHPPSLPSSPFK